MKGSPVNDVALCGLGNMGSAIAARLSPHVRLHGYDIDAARASALASDYGFHACADVKDLADSPVVVLCLPNPRASLSVVAAAAPHLRADAVIVETSTSSPSDVHALADIAGRHRIGVIDAAIAAGVNQMRNGSAALLVSGSDADIERAASVLDTIAPKQVRLGALGAGSALKVINNAVAHAVMVVLVEAAAMADACGVPREHLIELLAGEEAGLTRPLEHRLIERIAEGDFSGGMPTEAARKDSVLALGLAEENGVPLFAIQAAHAVYEIAVAEGKGRLDYAAIVQLWERWLGHSLSAR